jgi:hypothetical protein
MPACEAPNKLFEIKAGIRWGEPIVGNRKIAKIGCSAQQFKPGGFRPVTPQSPTEREHDQSMFSRRKGRTDAIQIPRDLRHCRFHQFCRRRVVGDNCHGLLTRLFPYFSSR